MLFKEAATAVVHEALNGQMDYLVLRGLDQFAHEDGDIDLLVPSGRSGEALLRVTERAVDAGWTVAGVGDIGYLTQICLVQRGDEDSSYRAIKVDFFNGANWAGLGRDPLGRLIFDELHENLSEAEAIGLATLLQKTLYAGYLRERDRDRIAATCAPERIKALIDLTGLPLSHADLNRGRLSRCSRWRIRAASAGVGIVGMPHWGLNVIGRKLQSWLVRSTIPGHILLLTGGDAPRRAAVIARFQSILESSGFPSPLALQDTETGRMGLIWRRFRGETVILQAASSLSVPTGSTGLVPVLQVQISERDAYSDDDLERVLTAMSQGILETLRRKFPL